MTLTDKAASFARTETEERTVGQWQTIESAPKGEGQILVFCSDGLFIAEWNDRHRCWMDSTDNAPFGEQMDWPEPPWAPATHWMPLPAHPSA